MGILKRMKNAVTELVRPTAELMVGGRYVK